MRLADGEDAPFWSGLFDDLKERGLRGVKLVVSDGHKGIQKAVQSAFLGASWQMCHVHFSRAVLRNVPKKDQAEIAEMIKDALENQNETQTLVSVLEERGYSKSVNTVEMFSYDLWNYMAFPKDHWRRIRTTNGVERINKELKRRSRVAGAFPTSRSLLRLAVSIMMDINEEWVTGKRYLSMEGQ